MRFGRLRKKNVGLYQRTAESTRVVFVSFRYACCVSFRCYVSFRGYVTFRFEISLRVVVTFLFISLRFELHFASFFVSFCYVVAFRCCASLRFVAFRAPFRFVTLVKLRLVLSFFFLRCVVSFRFEAVYTYRRLVRRWQAAVLSYDGSLCLVMPVFTSNASC